MATWTEWLSMGGSSSPTLLCERDDTANKTSEKIELSLSNYTHIMVVSERHLTDAVNNIIVIENTIGNTGRIAVNEYFRVITITSTGVTVGVGQQYNLYSGNGAVGSFSGSNSPCQASKIYGLNMEL